MFYVLHYLHQIPDRHFLWSECIIDFKVCFQRLTKRTIKKSSNKLITFQSPQNLRYFVKWFVKIWIFKVLLLLFNVEQSFFFYKVNGVHLKAPKYLKYYSNTSLHKVTSLKKKYSDKKKNGSGNTWTQYNVTITLARGCHDSRKAWRK